MTDSPRSPDNSLDPCDLPDDAASVTDIIITTPRGKRGTDPYDFEWLFLCWAWESGYRDWDDGVRALARALRGLERTGLIERRTIRRVGKPVHHGFILTDLGRQALSAVSGDWIEKVD